MSLCIVYKTQFIIRLYHWHVAYFLRFNKAGFIGLDLVEFGSLESIGRHYDSI